MSETTSAHAAVQNRAASIAPSRTRRIGRRDVHVDDAGRFFAADFDFAERSKAGSPTPADLRFLADQGMVLEPGGLAAAAHRHARALRRHSPTTLDYLILVPTLRCDLACSYCQVSRVDASRPGHDWTDETLHHVLALVDRLPTHRIKIEFQGGEPTLRPDLIRAVIERCERFPVREFVVCTNLQSLETETLQLLDRPNVFVSTSLDGLEAVHARNRTGTNERTRRFMANLGAVVERYGPGKVSALPTIDPADPPDIDELINVYAHHGLDSIFLRPINYQGFARKRHVASRETNDAWGAYHERFVRRLIELNWSDRGRVMEETYLSIALRRIFQPGHDRHVDLRSPNSMGVDYVVVDYDGTIYPTDEARMLARSGVIDLAIGTVRDGWASPIRDLLNAHSTNEGDPDCERCAYQPFCGRDVVDDLARYGRIDLPRHETEFCRRHLRIFDLAFSLIYSDDPAVRYSLSRWLRVPGEPDSFGAMAS